MKLGLIGCGNMGSGMATQLLKAGFELTCYDPNQSSLNRVNALGAISARSAVAVAQASEVIILSLPKAEIVEAVMNEIASSIQPNSVVLDTSTSEPATSQAMSALGADHSTTRSSAVGVAPGFAFVDGPVSGGPSAANAGTMTMLLGGELDAIEQLQPVLNVLTAKAIIVGGSGAGHAAKIANNMLCAANLVLVAEAVRLGEAAGVKAEDLLEGINAGSGRSGVSEVNFPKWVLNGGFDSGFTMGLMRKDVGLAVELARTSNVALNGFSQISDVWLNQSSNIPDDADFNEIVKHVNEEIEER